MSTRKKFFENTGWIIIGNVFHMAISLIISIFSARYLGPSNLGLINYSASIVAIMSSFTALGFNETIMKFLVEKEDDQGTVLGTGIFFRLIASTIAFFAVLVIVCIVRPGNKLLLLIAALQSIGLTFQSFGILTQWFQSRFQSKVPAMTDSFAYLVVSLYKLFLLINGWGVVWFALASVIEYVIIAVFLYIAYKKNEGADFHINLSYGIKMIKQSYHFIISGFMVIAYGQMDKLMIGTMMDDTATGIYSVALNLCTAWAFLLSAVVNSASPIIYRYNRDHNPLFDRRIRQLLSAIIMMGGTVAILIMIFAKPIIRWFGSGYEEAVIPLILLSWYSMFQYIGTIRTMWATCKGLQRYEKTLSGIGLLCNVVMNYVLIKAMGINGAAIATLVTQIITSMGILVFIPDLRPFLKIALSSFKFWDVADKAEIKKSIALVKDLILHR